MGLLKPTRFRYAPAVGLAGCEKPADISPYPRLLYFFALK